MVIKVVIKGEHRKVPTEQINKNRTELRAGQSLAVLTLNGKMAGKNASWFERFVIAVQIAITNMYSIFICN